MKNYAVLIRKYGYIAELRFPIDQSRFTEDVDKAQQFHDLEWIKEKFDWYMGKENYWVEEIKENG